MRILVVSYSYAPDPTPRAYRWSAIAEYWTSRGHEVDVVCGWKPGDARFERRNGVSINRVGGMLSESARGLLGRRSHRDASGPGSAMRPSLMAGFATWIYGLTWRRVYWPDYACLWWFAAAPAAKRLCLAKGYAGAITVSHPFTSHLVGLTLKRRFPSLRWVADIGDPFSLPAGAPQNNLALYAALNRWIDGRVCARADAMSVTVDSCRDAYVSAFPACRDRIRVIPPLCGGESASRPAARVLPARGNGGLNLVFSGRLYRALRRPDYLLALIARLVEKNPAIHLHLFGDLNDCAGALSPYGPLVGRNIHLHGVQPRGVVLSAQREADILINIGNDSAYQLPSKVIEYIAAGKPILNIASSPGDSAARCLAAHPAVLNIITTDMAPDDDTTERVYRFVSTPSTVDAATIAELTSPYTIERIAGAYEEILGHQGTPSSRQRVEVSASHQGSRTAR